MTHGPPPPLCSPEQSRDTTESAQVSSRGPNVNGKIVIFGNKRLMNAQNEVADGKGQKNCQNSQISGLQNAVKRAAAGMEAVGALLSVPKDKPKV